MKSHFFFIDSQKEFSKHEHTRRRQHTGNGHRDDPREYNVSKQDPRHTLAAPRCPADADYRTDLAMSRRYG